jgi:hypothetical protein
MLCGVFGRREMLGGSGGSGCAQAADVVGLSPGLVSITLSSGLSTRDVTATMVAADNTQAWMRLLVPVVVVAVGRASLGLGLGCGRLM